MIINFILGGIFRSGGMRVIFEYANRLVKKSHNVILYYPIIPYNFYKGQFAVIYNLKNYYWRLKEILYYKNILSNLYPYNFEIRRVLNINNNSIRNADATIATQWPTAYSVNNLLDTKGKKIYFIQDYEVWNSNTTLVDGSYKLPLKRISISKSLRNFLLERFNADSKVIYNGMNFSVFYNNGDKIFKKRKKRILYIDNDLKRKSSVTGIEIIKRLKEKYSNIDFTCFGYKKYHDFPDYVKFIENPTDDIIRKLYCEADIFLFTSISEGFGLPPAEAMACKCVVVTNAVGAIPEYAVNNETAILTNRNKPEELFEGICYLLDNENELEKISIGGYNKVRGFFNWNKSINEFEKFISQ